MVRQRQNTATAAIGLDDVRAATRDTVCAQTRTRQIGRDNRGMLATTLGCAKTLRRLRRRSRAAVRRDDATMCPDRDVVDFSDMRPTVVIQDCDSGSPNVVFPDGSTLMDRVTALIASNPRNHGQFVSALNGYLNDAKKLGLMTGAQTGAVDVCAAQSTIGR